MRSPHPRRACAALCATLAVGLAAPAAAVTVFYDFTATTTGITDPDNVLNASVAGGFSVSYTIDSDALDADPGPVFGAYDGAILSVTIALGDMTLVLDPGSTLANRMWIVDDFDLGGTFIDGYAPVLDGASGTLDGAPVSAGHFSAYLASSDTSLWASDAMPLLMPPFPAPTFDTLNDVTVLGTVGGSSFQVTGTISAMALPEPSSGLLLGLGLVVIAARRRRAQVR